MERIIGKPTEKWRKRATLWLGGTIELDHTRWRRIRRIGWRLLRRIQMSTPITGHLLRLCLTDKCPDPPDLCGLRGLFPLGHLLMLCPMDMFHTCPGHLIKSARHMWSALTVSPWLPFLGCAHITDSIHTQATWLSPPDVCGSSSTVIAIIYSFCLLYTKLEAAGVSRRIWSSTRQSDYISDHWTGYLIVITWICIFCLYFFCFIIILYNI